MYLGISTWVDRIKTAFTICRNESNYFRPLICILKIWLRCSCS